MALHYEQQKSDGLGATIAQQVLSVTEAILQEESSQRTVVQAISEEVGPQETHVTMGTCVTMETCCHGDMLLWRCVLSYGNLSNCNTLLSSGNPG